MREIKFRAWAYINCYELTANKPKGTGSHWEGKWVMCEVSTIHLKKGTCRLIYKRGNGTESVDKKIGDNCYIMEYIGLNAGIKEKVPIYEGDITEGIYGTCVVVRDTRCAKFQLEIQYTDNGDSFGIRQTHTDIPIDAGFLKVIGNIHQNGKIIKK